MTTRGRTTRGRGSGHIPRHRLIASLVLLLGLALFITGLALATEENAKIEATQFFVDDGQTEAESAKCPGSKRAVGGGVVQSGSYFSLRVNASGPLDSSGSFANTKDGDVATQWRATVYNLSGENNRIFRVFAICAGDVDARLEATRFEVDANQTKHAVAKCTGSRRVLGGGVMQSGNPESLLVAASGPLDGSGITANTKDGDVAKRWYAAIYNYSGTNNRVFKVFAICANDSHAKIEATKFSVKPFNGNEQLVECPGSKRALGGGVVQYGFPDGLAVQGDGPLDASGTTVNTDDGDVARQWYVAVTDNADLERDLKAFAICV